MATPSILVCPADDRARAKNSGPSLSNTNLSYFFDLDATESSPEMLLTGDRNLTNGLPLVNGILVLTSNNPTGWTHEMHHLQGNTGLADGSVQACGQSRLREVLLNSGATNRLAMP